ncbi:MAG: hypothetical protein RLZZ387_242 [Chloroflexota bacterium]
MTSDAVKPLADDALFDTAQCPQVAQCTKQRLLREILSRLIITQEPPNPSGKSAWLPGDHLSQLLASTRCLIFFHTLLPFRGHQSQQAFS